MKLYAALAIGLLSSASGLLADTVYLSIQNPLPPGMPSLGYQASATSEFGNAINLAGSARSLTSVDIVMTNWAYQSMNMGFGDASGYAHAITLNLYSTTGTDAVGSLISTKTVDAFIPWRPEPGGGCANNGYLGGDGMCYSGSNSIVTFDFSGDAIVLPDNLIYGVAFNTQSYGTMPTSVSGPYNSLNFGLGGGATPSVGSNIYADSAYWNTSVAGFYNDGGAGGTGTFRRDTAWDPYEGNIAITATTPEPGTFILLGGAMALVELVRRRSTRKN